MTDSGSHENKRNMKNRFQTQRIQTIIPKEIVSKMLETAINNLHVTSIEAAVCSEVMVDSSVLHSRSRKRKILLARQLMMYFLSCSFDYTYERIAFLYGFDHATCMHSKRLIENLMSVDRKVYCQVTNIAHRIIFKAL